MKHIKLFEDFLNEEVDNKLANNLINALKKSHNFDDLYVDAGFKLEHPTLIIGSTYDPISTSDIDKVLKKLKIEATPKVTKQKSVQTEDGYWEVIIKLN